MAKRGETREVILKAATKVFFENGYEASSVKMLIAEAGVVIGSFYHFFESKEALFEGVVQRFIDEYIEGISKILKDDSLSFYDMMNKYVEETKKANKKYDEMLNGDKLHWSLKYALHDRILDTVIKLYTEMLINRIEQGEIVSLDNMSINTLANIMVKGTDIIIADSNENTKIIKFSEKYISVNADFKRSSVKMDSENISDKELNKIDAINKNANEENAAVVKASNTKKKKALKPISKKEIVKDNLNNKNEDIIKDNSIDNKNLQNINKKRSENSKKSKTSNEVTYQQMSIFEFE